MKREEIFEKYDIVSYRLKHGRPDKDFCIYGDIKTAQKILKEIDTVAEADEDIHLIKIDETLTDETIADYLAETAKSLFGEEALERVRPWLGDSYDTDQIDNIITAIGSHLQNTGQMVHISINRPDKLGRHAFSMILTGKHRCNQMLLPVFIACAGGKRLLRIAGDLKGYAERLFYVLNV